MISVGSVVKVVSSSSSHHRRRKCDANTVQTVRAVCTLDVRDGPTKINPPHKEATFSYLLKKRLRAKRGPHHGTLPDDVSAPPLKFQVSTVL
jgi:hypothetical protein